MTATTTLPAETYAPPRRRSLVQHAFVRGATAMPLGVVGGAVLGWIGEAPTDAVRLEQTTLVALLIGLVLAPSLAAALGAARYDRPSGSALAVLIRSIGIPALAGLAWALLGMSLILLISPATTLEFPLTSAPLTAGTTGLGFGAVIGLLTMLVRLARPSGADQA